MIDRTRTGVKRVASIVEKMRGLARTSPPKWETVSLADLVDNALEMMRGRLKHQRVEVSVKIHDVTRIECVPDQIGQVLLNLLINALQAIESTWTPGGGADRGRGAADRAPGSRSRCATTVPASSRNIASGCSIRSSRPSPWARARGWDWRSVTASFPAMAAGSRSRADRARGAASGSCCRNTLSRIPPPQANSSIPPPPPA